MNKMFNVIFRQDSDDAGTGRRVLNLILSRMCNIQGQVTVIAATNFPAQLDRAFLSRITNFINMPLPDDSTKKMLFIKYLKDSDLSHNMSPEHLTKIAKEKERFSFRDCQR